MKYALIKNCDAVTGKFIVVSIKEVEILPATAQIKITSMKDEEYVEQYASKDQLLARMKELNTGITNRDIADWTKNLG